MFPGYKHVDSFGPDDDYETKDGELEQVEYVTLDLGTTEPTLVPSSSSFRLIGLDSPNPFLQLSGTILKGQHASLLGTELLFAETDANLGVSPAPPPTEEQTSSGARGKNHKQLVHVANAERRIRFREVELKPKTDGAPDSQDVVPSSSVYAAKTPNLAKKVVTQMNHVMGSAKPARRGRGRGRGRKQTATAARPPVEDSAEEFGEQKELHEVSPSRGVSTSTVSQDMDTSEG